MLNQDYTCLPQDEMSIFVNPLDTRNIVGGANDYRLGWGSSGFYSTTDGYGRNGDDHGHGQVQNGDGGDGSRSTTGSERSRRFRAARTTSTVAVTRRSSSTAAALRTTRTSTSTATTTRTASTWPARQTAATRGAGRARRSAEPTRPRSAAVSATRGSPETVESRSGRTRTHVLNGSVPFDDKSYMTAGPRPSGVSPVCYLPISRTPTACDPALVGPDRLYVTWTRFDNIATAQIMASISDDRGRSWSDAIHVSTTAPFCDFGVNTGDCDNNQYSSPKVNPTTGVVWVSYENFNTPDENQYLVSRSNDGGQTWSTPLFITSVFDVNYPQSGNAGGRPDCAPRGQGGGRRVLTNSCFRLNAGGPLVVDKRGGAFADDLYQFMSDNRNGTRVSTNTDVLMFKSTNGGGDLGRPDARERRPVQPAGKS